MGLDVTDSEGRGVIEPAPELALSELLLLLRDAGLEVSREFGWEDSVESKCC